MKKRTSVLILGIINMLLPILVVLIHQGFFGTPEGANGWRYVYIGLLLVCGPMITSVVGMILAGRQCRQAPGWMARTGLALSAAGLLMQILFRFVFKI